MPAYPLTALVLRLTKLGETDMIATLLAEDGSQVRAVAKGARKPTSRFAGRVQPYATLALLLHTGKALEVVTEAQTVSPRRELRADYDRNAAAAVVVDVLDKISLEGQTEERLFQLASVALDRMCVASVDALPRLVTAFLIKAMAMHGYRPELEHCAACAGEVRGDSLFSLQQGGVVCESCGGVDPASLHMPAAAREWLSVLLNSTMAEVEGLDMPRGAVLDTFAIVRAFMAYHLPARLKALDFYAGMLADR